MLTTFFSPTRPPRSCSFVSICYRNSEVLAQVLPVPNVRASTIPTGMPAWVNK